MKRRLLRRAGRRGNAMLEGALVLWPLVLLMFGIMQVGFAIWSQSTLAFAVNAAARYGSVHGSRSADPATAEDIRAVLRDNATGLNPSELNIEVTFAPNNHPGSTVDVDASYNLPTLVNTVWPNAFALRSKTRMLILN